jgi:hypothetical protein
MVKARKVFHAKAQRKPLEIFSGNILCKAG